MKGSLLAVVAAVTVALAVPVAASAHPMDANAGTAFMPELPELSLQMEAQAGRGWFSGSPPTAYDKTANMRFLGFTSRPAPEFAQFNSDLAFQGSRAYQGSFQGFRILDVRNPFGPREIINYQDCQHPSGQGDVVIYGDVLTRSWDSAAATARRPTAGPAATSCPQAGPEGLHVFDVSNPREPKVAKYIPLPCGSHTATGVPDPQHRAAHRLQHAVVGHCDGIDVISIPLRDPGSAPYVGFEPAADLIACHDTGVILGDVLRAACAGGQGFAVWSLDPRGGRFAHRPEAALHEERQGDRGHQHQHRALGRVLQRR